VTDWGVGRYERTAAVLEPAAARVVKLAAPRLGEHLLDLGCGTGNAALIAARAGAEVTGVDPAQRLVSVARERADAEELDARFVVGDAVALPFADDAFDVVVSVFAVIFAPDPPRAFAELVRVLRPGGRAVISAWLPEGPISASVGISMRAVAAATGRPLPERFGWHEPERIRELAARHGASASYEDAEISFTADSPEAFLAADEEHPMRVAARPVLERAGSYEQVGAEILQVMRDANEDPSAFRTTSRYRIHRIERPAR
jgi:SAM-dependent methyltransferase